MLFDFLYSCCLKQFSFEEELNEISKINIGLHVKCTALQVGRSRVRFPVVSLVFFIDIILPAALWPWG